MKASHEFFFKAFFKAQEGVDPSVTARWLARQIKLHGLNRRGLTDNHVLELCRFACIWLSEGADKKKIAAWLDKQLGVTK